MSAIDEIERNVGLNVTCDTCGRSLTNARDLYECRRHFVAERARLRQWLTLRLEDRLVDHIASLPGEGQPDGSRKLVRPPSHQELGESIGSGREQVCRLIAAMRRTGEIVYGRMDPCLHRRPVVLLLSKSLLERAERIRSLR